MLSAIAGGHRRGAPEPLRPEEIEPVGRMLAELYQHFRRLYGETQEVIYCVLMIVYRDALKQHVRETEEPVEANGRRYTIGLDERLVDLPIADHVTQLHREQDAYRV